MFYGLDVHKEFIQVCRLWPNGKQRQDFQIPGTAEALGAFARTLTRKDQVALEVTFHTWAICQLLAPHAGRVVAVDATQVKAIASARIKTDKVDAHTLACMSRYQTVPLVISAAIHGISGENSSSKLRWWYTPRLARLSHRRGSGV